MFVHLDPHQPTCLASPIPKREAHRETCLKPSSQYPSSHSLPQHNAITKAHHEEAIFDDLSSRSHSRSPSPTSYDCSCLSFRSRTSHNSDNSVFPVQTPPPSFNGTGKQGRMSLQRSKQNSQMKPTKCMDSTRLTWNSAAQLQSEVGAIEKTGKLDNHSHPHPHVVRPPSVHVSQVDARLMPVHRHNTPSLSSTPSPFPTISSPPQELESNSEQELESAGENDHDRDQRRKISMLLRTLEEGAPPDLKLPVSASPLQIDSNGDVYTRVKYPPKPLTPAPVAASNSTPTVTGKASYRPEALLQGVAKKNLPGTKSHGASKRLDGLETGMLSQGKNAKLLKKSGVTKRTAMGDKFKIELLETRMLAVGRGDLKARNIARTMATKGSRHSLPAMINPLPLGSTLSPVERGRRKEREWSGEWNLGDIEEVVKALRELRAR